MKPLPALLVSALLGLGATGCGDSTETTHSASAPVAFAPANVPTITTAALAHFAFDADDGPIVDFGHEASASVRRAIALLVTRYYAFAARADGAAACTLLHSLIAETIVEKYGELHAMRGDSCSIVLSKLFKQHQQQLVSESTTLESDCRACRRRPGASLASLRARFRTGPHPRAPRAQRVEDMGIARKQHALGKMQRPGGARCSVRMADGGVCPVLCVFGVI